MKVCSKCFKELDDSCFYKTESACKECRSKRKYQLRRDARVQAGLKVHFPTSVARALLKEGKKHCPGCKKVLDLSHFSTMRKRNGIASHCRHCSRKIARKISSTKEAKQKKKIDYLKNKTRAKNNHLMSRFGITYAKYQEMLVNQNHCCKICGKTEQENGKMLAVDHCHRTEKIRSLLCSSCNICIGFIEKNKISIKAIEDYLENYEV